MEERSFEYRFLLEEPEGKRPFGRPRLKWDVNPLPALTYHSVVDLNAACWPKRTKA
jgi:hypothetical protein